MRSSRQSEFKEILKRLETDILSGFFHPKERLIEKSLCQRYQASRGTIRQVLKELEFKQLINHHSNRGAVIAEPTKKEIEDIFGTRVLLENHALDFVIQNIDRQTLAQVITYQAAFEKAAKAKNLRAIMNSNRLFHNGIFQTCGNVVITEIIDQLRKRSHMWQHYIVGQPGRMQKTIEEHRDIVRCLQTGNASKLKKLNEQHLAEGYKSYMEDLTRFQN